jgi:hypothetical protein
MKFNSDAAINKAQIEVLEKCHRSFSNAAWNRLMEKHVEGHRGWDSSDWTKTKIQGRLAQAASKQKWDDVAMFAMFLWNREGEEE